MSAEANPNPAAPALRIVHGGVPDAAELAALVLALTPVSVGQPGVKVPAWSQAARREATGAGALVRPSDLTQRWR